MPRHARAEAAHGLGGRQNVFSLEQPADPGFAYGKRPENQRTMRNRLVAGDANPTGEPMRRLRGEAGGR